MYSEGGGGGVGSPTSVGKASPGSSLLRIGRGANVGEADGVSPLVLVSVGDAVRAESYSASSLILSNAKKSKKDLLQFVWRTNNQ